MVDVYYAGTDAEGLSRCTGGYLHIVTDDYNVEDGHVWHCLRDAAGAEDRDAATIAVALLHLPVSEREKIVHGEYGRQS